MNRTKFSLMIFTMVVLLLGVTSRGAETNTTSVSAPKEAVSKEFVFGGGDLDNFVGALGNTFGVDLYKIATIPDHMRSVRVPKMRTMARSFEDVLSLYNATSSEIDGVMGKWAIKYSENGYVMDYKAIKANRLPDVLLLTGKEDQNAPGKRLAVKAFAFKGLSDKGLDDLQLVVLDEASALEQQMRRSGRAGGSEIQGNIRYHRTAGILVVSGGTQYVEMAGSIIEAYRQAHGPEFNDLPGDTTSNKK